MSLQASRTAMVFAHPAHEFAVSGLIQRLQPHLLFLTPADGNGGSRREEITRKMLASLDFCGTATFLRVSEKEIYANLLASDIGWFQKLGERVMAWLDLVQPETVFVDAFEAFNPSHDLCSLLVEWGLQRLMATSLMPERFEVPLAYYDYPHRSAAEFDDLEQPFSFEKLSPAEQRNKRLMARVAARGSEELAKIATGLLPERFQWDICRQLPVSHDYHQMPRVNGWITYEEHGKRRVAEGSYSQAIQFRKHFLPIVQALEQELSIPMIPVCEAV